MYHFFILAEQVKEPGITITGSDVNHIKNVLRMKNKEQLTVTDEDGVEYLCEIDELQKDSIQLAIIEKKEANHELPAHIYLFQGLPKGDKMELIIQKAVELGVFQVIPITTRRCVVKLDEKKREAKLRRWNAVAESAAKQSKRSIIPTVAPVMNFREAVDYAHNFGNTCIPYEHAKGMKATEEFLNRLKPDVDTAFFIGPEGGFEEEEIAYAADNQIMPVSLGGRVLRTETAGMALLSMMMLKLEGCER